VPHDFVFWLNYLPKTDQLMKCIVNAINTHEEFGYGNVDTIFDEWNYTAGGWKYESREGTQTSFLKTKGLPGAAFTPSMLASILDSELDAACYMGNLKWRYSQTDFYIRNEIV
jgi:hypothetical protein